VSSRPGLGTGLYADGQLDFAPEFYMAVRAVGDRRISVTWFAQHPAVLGPDNIPWRRPSALEAGMTARRAMATELHSEVS